MDARANNRSSRGSQRDLWGAKLFAKKGLRAWRTVPIIHATGKTPRPHTDMKRTIIIRCEEHVDCNIVLWTSGSNAKIDYHLMVAKPFGLKWDSERGPLPYEIDKEMTLDQLDERICSIAAKYRMKVRRVGPTVWAVTRRIAIRKQHRFPTVSGASATKWGPTDFYDDVRDDVLAAVRSGLDFCTDWLSCKKEPVSCRITRSLGRTQVEVSVCGEGDESGHATTTTQVHKHMTDDEILSRLDRAGNKAWRLAQQDMEGWIAEAEAQND